MSWDWLFWIGWPAFVSIHAWFLLREVMRSDVDGWREPLYPNLPVRDFAGSKGAFAFVWRPICIAAGLFAATTAWEAR